MRMRGLNAVQLIDKLVENSSNLLTVTDITDLFVSSEFVLKVLDVLNRVAPLGTVTGITRQPLASITNL